MISKLDQYVISCIHQYPTLYQADSYTEAKMKVLDQFLNTIGNGVRDNEELAEELGRVNPEVTMDDIVSIVSGESMFTGYTEVKDIGSGDFKYTMPELDSDVCVVTESEKENWPQVIHWTESSKHSFNPYPNFQKRYSTIYQCPDYLELDVSFIDGAIEFYEYCLQWLKENENKYHYSFPRSTEKKTQKCLDDMAQMLERYESNEAISEAYEMEYTGDLYDFNVRRWQKEKSKILSFIDETLAMLHEIKAKKSA